MGGETASCNSSESVNGGRGGCCSVGDALLLRGCYCSGSGDSQGVKPQRRNLQHGEDDMRRVFGIMIMCLVAERRRLLRGRLAGNQGARQKRLRMSFLVADRLLLFVARGSLACCCCSCCRYSVVGGNSPSTTQRDADLVVVGEVGDGNWTSVPYRCRRSLERGSSEDDKRRKKDERMEGGKKAVTKGRRRDGVPTQAGTAIEKGRREGWWLIGAAVISRPAQLNGQQGPVRHGTIERRVLEY